ncbi:MAG: ATP-binding protein [Paludibacter sp.]
MDFWKLFRTTEKLKKIHTSIPANPLLAEPMYLKGYIERVGSGTLDILRIARENGLQEPVFEQDDSFKTILYRMQTTQEVSGEVLKVIMVLEGEMKRSEIQQVLQLKHDDYFRVEYILPALESGVIEQTHPESPNHPQQHYKLTEKGKQLKSEKRQE